MTWWFVAAKVAIVVLLGAVAVVAGGRAVLAVFARVERSQGPASATTGEPTPPPIAAAAQVLRGGAWIGTLERLAVYGTLVAGYPEGIAIALALKGLARYPELKATTSGAAERFIIGTFVSVMAAAACAGLAWWLVRLF